MGLFSSKKTESISLSDADEMLKNPRQLRGMSKKQIDDLKRRAAGKTNIIADIKAVRKDVKSGRKLGGVGDPPPVRKGRSMWS